MRQTLPGIPAAVDQAAFGYFSVEMIFFGCYVFIGRLMSGGALRILIKGGRTGRPVACPVKTTFNVSPFPLLQPAACILSEKVTDPVSQYPAGGCTGH